MTIALLKVSGYRSLGPASTLALESAGLGAAAGSLRGGAGHVTTPLSRMSAWRTVDIGEARGEMRQRGGGIRYVGSGKMGKGWRVSPQHAYVTY